jgi:redox-regulated HSP33 family molecular chaperone
MWEIQETDEALLLQDTIQSEEKKNETIISVIKRLFGEHITSRLVRTQNRELLFRCIAYNMHRLTNLIIIIDYFY